MGGALSKPGGKLLHFGTHSCLTPPCARRTLACQHRFAAGEPCGLRGSAFVAESDRIVEFEADRQREIIAFYSVNLTLQTIYDTKRHVDGPSQPDSGQGLPRKNSAKNKISDYM